MHYVWFSVVLVFGGQCVISQMAWEPGEGSPGLAMGEVDISVYRGLWALGLSGVVHIHQTPARAR